MASSGTVPSVCHVPLSNSFLVVAQRLGAPASWASIQTPCLSVVASSLALPSFVPPLLTSSPPLTHLQLNQLLHCLRLGIIDARNSLLGDTGRVDPTTYSSQVLGGQVVLLVVWRRVGSRGQSLQCVEQVAEHLRCDCAGRWSGGGVGVLVATGGEGALRADGLAVSVCL